MKIVKQMRRAKTQSKYEYKDVFTLCYANHFLPSRLSFRCEEMSVEGECCSSSAKLCAPVSMCADYLTPSVKSYAYFLMPTLNTIPTIRYDNFILYTVFP